MQHSNFAELSAPNFHLGRLDCSQNVARALE
jgi:hypothetical protein